MKIESGQEGNVRTVRAYGEPLPKGIELGSDFMRAVAGNFMVRVDYDYGSAIAVAFSKDALREWYLGQHKSASAAYEVGDDGFVEVYGDEDSAHHFLSQTEADELAHMAEEYARIYGENSGAADSRHYCEQRGFDPEQEGFVLAR